MNRSDTALLTAILLLIPISIIASPYSSPLAQDKKPQTFPLKDIPHSEFKSADLNVTGRIGIIHSAEKGSYDSCDMVGLASQLMPVSVVHVGEGKALGYDRVAKREGGGTEKSGDPG